MITGIKAYSIDRYCEKLAFIPTTKTTRFKKFYFEGNEKLRPKKQMHEDAEAFRQLLLSDYSFSSGKFRFERDMKFKKNRFKCVYRIYYQNPTSRIHFGYLSWYNYVPGYEINLISLDISNNLFYNLSVDIEQIRIELLDKLGLEHHNYERIDICLDTNFNIIRKFNKMFSDSKKYYFKASGKKNKMVFDYGNRIREKVTGQGHMFLSESFKLRYIYIQIEFCKPNFIFLL